MFSRSVKLCISILLTLSFLSISVLDGNAVVGATFVVNDAGDAPDINPGDGICETDKENGICTLRAAIREANALAGADTITFQIVNESGLAFPQIIEVANPLPSITEQLTIQGPNVGRTGSTADLILDGDGSFNGLEIEADDCVIRGLTIRNFRRGIYSHQNRGLLVAGNRIGKFGYSLSGTVYGNADDGVYLERVISTVIGGDVVSDRNLISGNGGDGITLYDTSTSVVKGNYIGTDESGSIGLPNSGSGIVIAGVNSTSNTIGGSVAGRRNLISANVDCGIYITSDDNSVFGNYIGVTITGTKALPNQNDGIYLKGSVDDPVVGNRIGGIFIGEGNLISGNQDFGIRLVYANSTLIRHNTIGSDAAKSTAIPNAEGVVIISGSNNQIGTTENGSGNTISGNTSNGIRLYTGLTDQTSIRRNYIGSSDFGGMIPNGGAGIYIYSSNNVTIGGSQDDANVIANNGAVGIDNEFGQFVLATHNRIYDNTGLGINLRSIYTDEGVTPNDPDDEDFGSNALQNFPLLTRVKSGDPGHVIVQGQLNSSKNRIFQIHFYANDSADPSGHGEGQYFLGSLPVTIGEDYNAAFTADLPVVLPFNCITATASDPQGYTSEFSTCVPLMEQEVFLPLITK